MENYLWLNPVVTAMYPADSLENELSAKGFHVVACRRKITDLVKSKYRRALEQAGKCLLDGRCPKAREYFLQNHGPDSFAAPAIHPILIESALEIHRRYAGKGRLYIVTPCDSLKAYGERLGLSGTRFFTWKEFVGIYQIETMPSDLKESPIPPGFFAEYADAVLSLPSKEKIDQLGGNPDLGGIRIIELLYCPDGCHNGDGIP
ncbi:MAG: hypothetical protein LBQ97_00815 [Fusobacteriaceae bacterium]|jgi:hypothetical protein|nr:hypothetical protein [Fusobacteriaceae bacterium]